MLGWFTGKCKPEYQEEPFDDLVDPELRRKARKEAAEKKTLRKSIQEHVDSRQYSAIRSFDLDHVDIYKFWDGSRYVAADMVEYVKDMTDMKVTISGSFGKVKRLIEVIPMEWFMKQNRIFINISEDVPCWWQKDSDKPKKKIVDGSSYAELEPEFNVHMRRASVECNKDRDEFLATIFKICGAFVQEFRAEKIPLLGNLETSEEELKKQFCTSLYTDEDTTFMQRRRFDSVIWREFYVSCPNLKMSWNELLRNVLFADLGIFSIPKHLSEAALDIVRVEAESFEVQESFVQYVHNAISMKAQLMEEKQVYLTV